MILLAREDVEVHLHAPQTKTEHFWLCVWRTVVLKNCLIVRKQHLDHRMHLATANVHVVTGSNSTIQNKYRTSRIVDTAAQIIKIWLHVSQLEPGIQDYRLSWAMSKHKPACVGNIVTDDSSDHIMYFQSSDGLFFTFWHCFQ